MELKIDRSNWKKVKLGDVACEYSKRINNPSKSGFDKFIGSSNIEQWDFKIRSWDSTDSVTSSMKLFESNDYLLVRRSLYASDFRERAPRADFSGVCSGDILTIKENTDMVVDGFLIGIFNSPSLWKFIVSNASGSITRRIKWKDLANYKFLLPPKDQQVQIAKLLWSLDQVIEKEKEVYNMLKKLLYSTNKFYFKMNNERIQIKKLVELKKLKKAKAGVSPYVEIGDINLINKKIRIKEKKSVNGSIYANKDSTLISKVRPNRGAITFLNNNTIVSGGFVALVPKADTVLPEYLFHLLAWNKKFNYQMSRLATGSTYPTISDEDVLNYKVPFVNINNQKEFLKLTTKQYNSLCLFEDKINSSKSLQKSLINQIF